MGTRIVLIGAGSAQFGLGTVGDIFKCRTLKGSTIVLHDINPTSLAGVERTARDYMEEKKLDYELVATTSRKDALHGADYCIISIEVGDRFALWEQDWRIAQQYGIRQVYGENGGPGGLFHSLRIIPPILEICDDVMKICPDAIVFNFSNPMSRICTTIKRKYPDLSFVGLCHEVASLPRHLPEMLDTPFANLDLEAGGLNHFSVLLKARYRDTGEDAYPDIREKAPKYFAGMPERGLFRIILERFGYLPITTDSHFGEYIQWAHDVVDHQGILDFYENYKRFCLGRVAQAQMEVETKSEEGWGDLSTSEEEISGGEMGPSTPIKGTHERVIPIIEGILTNSGHKELAVNVLNNGYIDNLPEEIVVEVPAIIDAAGVHGVSLGALPRGFAGLLRNQVAVHDLTAEAVLTSSRELVLQALLVDPVVHSFRAAEQTLDTMLTLQPQYLGYIK